MQSRGALHDARSGRIVVTGLRWLVRAAGVCLCCLQLGAGPVVAADTPEQNTQPPAESEVAGSDQTAVVDAVPEKSSPQSWLQWLEGRGFTPGVAWTNDWSKNFRGGACSRGSVNRYLLRSSLTARTDKLLGIRGGTAFVSLYHHLGGHGGDYAGDAQGFSNIDAPERTALYELWYEQEWSGGRVRIKAGKVDANTEFAAVANGADFLNSSMGYSPTILGFATYPQPRPSINLFIQPGKNLDLRAGLYDVAGAGAMLVIEGGRSWSVGANELNSRVAVGFWRRTGRMPCFDGDLKPGTNGWYLVAEQDVWRDRQNSRSDPRGVSVFLQYGRAQDDVSAVTRHLGGGVNWRGPWLRRAADSAGVGATWVGFSQWPGAGFETAGELAIEGYYRIHLSRFLSVSPDVQIIHHPGGLLCQGDAVVFTPRVTLTF